MPVEPIRADCTPKPAVTVPVSIPISIMAIGRTVMITVVPTKISFVAATAIIILLVAVLVITIIVLLCVPVITVVVAGIGIGIPVVAGIIPRLRIPVTAIIGSGIAAALVGGTVIVILSVAGMLRHYGTG